MGTIILRASRDIRKGEEVTISYRSNYYDELHTRRQHLYLKWKFVDQCELCQLEERYQDKLNEIQGDLDQALCGNDLQVAMQIMTTSFDDLVEENASSITKLKSLLLPNLEAIIEVARASTPSPQDLRAMLDYKSKLVRERFPMTWSHCLHWAQVHDVYTNILREELSRKC